MEQLFATYGLAAREPAEAPVEYLDRVLGELRASGAALGRLTGLFQRAKFSSHDVDESMRDEAIDSADTGARRAACANGRKISFTDGRRTSSSAPAPSRRPMPREGEDPFAEAANKARGSVYSGGRY